VAADVIVQIASRRCNAGAENDEQMIRDESRAIEQLNRELGQ